MNQQDWLPRAALLVFEFRVIDDDPLQRRTGHAVLPPASGSEWGGTGGSRLYPEPDQRGPEGGAGDLLAQRSAGPRTIDDVAIANIDSGGLQCHHGSPYLTKRRRLTTHSGARSHRPAALGSGWA